MPEKMILAFRLISCNRALRGGKTIMDRSEPAVFLPGVYVLNVIFETHSGIVSVTIDEKGLIKGSDGVLSFHGVLDDEFCLLSGILNIQTDTGQSFDVFLTHQDHDEANANRLIGKFHNRLVTAQLMRAPS